VIVGRRRQDTSDIGPMRQLSKSKATKILAFLHSLKPLAVLLRSQILDCLVGQLQTNGNFDRSILAYHADWRQEEAALLDVGEHLVDW
jgi:hypothetical protein